MDGDSAKKARSVGSALRPGAGPLRPASAALTAIAAAIALALLATLFLELAGAPQALAVATATAVLDLLENAGARYRRAAVAADRCCYCARDAGESQAGSHDHSSNNGSHASSIICRRQTVGCQAYAAASVPAFADAAPYSVNQTAQHDRGSSTVNEISERRFADDGAELAARPCSRFRAHDVRSLRIMTSVPSCSVAAKPAASYRWMARGL